LPTFLQLKAAQDAQRVGSQCAERQGGAGQSSAELMRRVERGEVAVSVAAKICGAAKVSRRAKREAELIEKDVLTLTDKLFNACQKDGDSFAIMLPATLALLFIIIIGKRKKGDRATKVFVRSLGEELSEWFECWVNDYGDEGEHDVSLAPPELDECHMSSQNAMLLTRKLALALRYERNPHVILLATVALLFRILLAGWGLDQARNGARQLGKHLPQLVDVWEDETSRHTH
jgi:hypothetical protein